MDRLGTQPNVKTKRRARKGQSQAFGRLSMQVRSDARLASICIFVAHRQRDKSGFKRVDRHLLSWSQRNPCRFSQASITATRTSRLPRLQIETGNHLIRAAQRHAIDKGIVS